MILVYSATHLFPKWDIKMWCWCWQKTSTACNNFSIYIYSIPPGHWNTQNRTFNGNDPYHQVQWSNLNHPVNFTPFTPGPLKYLLSSISLKHPKLRSPLKHQKHPVHNWQPKAPGPQTSKSIKTPKPPSPLKLPDNSVHWNMPNQFVVYYGIWFKFVVHFKMLWYCAWYIHYPLILIPDNKMH